MLHHYFFLPLLRIYLISQCSGLFTRLAYIIICVYALQLESLQTFIILALLVGTAQGGIQSLSRSLFGQLIPEGRSNEFFGFYNIFGKFAAVVGPFLVGIIAQITGNSLDGVFALIVLFVVGGVLLVRVKIPEVHEV